MTSFIHASTLELAKAVFLEDVPKSFAFGESVKAISQQSD